MSDPDVQDIFNASMSPRSKAEKLRTLVRRRQFPVLTSANNKIRETVQSLGLPEDIRMHWDETLENRGLKISIDIHDPHGWGEKIKRLSSSEIAAGIINILDEL